MFRCEYYILLWVNLYVFLGPDYFVVGVNFLCLPLIGYVHTS